KTFSASGKRTQRLFPCQSRTESNQEVNHREPNSSNQSQELTIRFEGRPEPKPSIIKTKLSMYYTDNSILPENMAPLIITAAPYGPAWLPGDASDIALTWDEQVQAAVDCYKAGATMLHFHVRNPATGMGSSNFDDYNYLLKR